MTINNQLAADIIAKLTNDGWDYSDFDVLGIRFETASRNVGDTIDNSRHNPDRNDERDFPGFGTDEYYSLPTLDGVSCLNASAPIANTTYFDDLHCYIIGGYEQGTHDDPDQYEILIRDAVVIEQIF